MRPRTTLAAGLLLAAGALTAGRATPAAGPPDKAVGTTVPVTAENFVRAETDRYFAGLVRRGGFGKWYHNREVTPVNQQTVVRMNRDTLYSAAVFDLDAGPVSVTLPDAGNRYLSMQAIDQDHYVPSVVYAAGKHVYGREQVGTRYAMIVVRILVNPADARDVARVHALQDALGAEQRDAGAFQVPVWDRPDQVKVRDALLALGATLPDLRRAFGPRGRVDPVRHLIGTAMAWGGNPDADAVYLNVTPARNDGTTVHRLTVKDVPVDAFWSISVYNPKGFFEPNGANAYAISNLTAKRNGDGTITVQFGGYDGRTPNCLPVPPGWNYLVRLYRPRKEILDGTWQFPEAQPVP